MILEILSIQKNDISAFYHFLPCNPIFNPEFTSLKCRIGIRRMGRCRVVNVTVGNCRGG